MPWGRGLPSWYRLRPATKETGIMGREIESRQGIRVKRGSLKNIEKTFYMKILKILFI
jgi:hypothetical protein